MSTTESVNGRTELEVVIESDEEGDEPISEGEEEEPVLAIVLEVVAVVVDVVVVGHSLTP